MKYVLKTPSLKNSQIQYEKELNEEQFRVVTEGDGPSLVLAGAGSGKTRTLVYRVAYLIEQGIHPENILLVTFTNKAAREMLYRVRELLGYEPSKLWGGTFHHIGNIILRKYASVLGLSPSFTIIDQDDVKTLLRSILNQYGEKRSCFPKPGVINSILSYCVNSQTPLLDYLHRRFPRQADELFEGMQWITNEFEKKKKISGTLDFDDLLLFWMRLLEKYHDVRKELSSQFQYILVDEYQDTNRIQANIIRYLGETHRNILVVGDDAQSIYSFRAAEVSNILHFPKVYPDAKIFHLETNYRSTPEILSLANHSISHNVEQFPKNLQANRANGGKKPAYVVLEDSRRQAQFVVQRILELRDQGTELSFISVLFRSAFQSLELELELSRRGIPYTMRGGLRFFEQAHIKDVVAFLKILFQWSDEISWRRILLMQEGIGERTVETILEMLKSHTSFEELLKDDLKTLSPKARIGFGKTLLFIKKLHEIFHQGLRETIFTLLSIGYENHIRKSFENFQDRIDDIKQLAEFSRGKTLESFLGEVMLGEGFRGEILSKEREDKEKLILSTIHQSKGLEWKVVFLIGLCEGQFPHYRVLENPKELEEERRLFYVAATRAKDELYLTSFIFQFSANASQSILHTSQFVSELHMNFFERWEVELAPMNDFFAEDNQYGDGILDRVARLRQKKKETGSDVEYIYE